VRSQAQVLVDLESVLLATDDGSEPVGRDGGQGHPAGVVGVAESTVVKHLEQIYARWGVHSHTQGVRLCGRALC
jgi:hypothetical protein